MEHFYLTKHAIDRLLERAPITQQHWPYLQDWNRQKDPNHFKTAFEEILAHSSENKSLINDTGYMAEYYWDKYGFDSEYRFFENQDYKIKFVFVKERSEKNFRLATVVPFYGQQKENKWAKTKSREEKGKERLLREYQQNEQFLTLVDRVSTKIINTRTPEYAIATKYDIKEQLYIKAQKGHTQFVEQLGTHATIQKGVVDGLEYEFKYHQKKPPAAIEVYQVVKAPLPINPPRVARTI